jgi:selenocysteine-specific elongation factor
VHVTGRIALLDMPEIAPGAHGFAQLVLSKPIHALHGDRFVLRDQAASRTLGGGTILDIFAPARYRRTPARLAMLAGLADTDPMRSLAQLLELAPTGVDLARFARTRNLRHDELALDGLRLKRVTTADGDYAFTPAHWAAMQDEACAALQAYHEKFPDDLGPDPQRLRRMAFAAMAPAIVAVLVEELIGTGRIAKSGPWLHLPEHSVNLSANEQQLAHKIAPLLEATPFDPPWVRDVAKQLGLEEQRVRQLLLRLARRGEVYQVVRDLFYSPRAIAELARAASRLENEQGDIRAAAFRDAIGIGRKRTIQVLEFFDRIGYTRRAGDAHRIRGDSLLELDRADGALNAASTS